MLWPWQKTRQAINQLTVAVCRLRDELREGIHEMSEILDALEAKVTRIETVGDSMEALMLGLAQELKDALAVNDPARIQAVIDSMETKATAWAAAVEATTPPPVEPPPTEPPPEEPPA